MASAAETRERRPTCVADVVVVNRFTDGVLDPSLPMLGPVRDEGTIIAETAPGCWGPMITPAIRGGHEVTIPVWYRSRFSLRCLGWTPAVWGRWSANSMGPRTATA